MHLCCRVRPWIVAAAAPQLAACGSHLCTMSAPSLYPLRTCFTSRLSPVATAVREVNDSEA